MSIKGDIVVWGDLRTHRYWRNSLKVLAKGRSLAESADVPLVMVLVGAPAKTAPDNRFATAACIPMEEAAQQGAAHGVRVVHCIEHPDLSVPRTDVYAGVLTDYIKQHRPWLMLFPLNSFGRETAAVCAKKCNTGLIADCMELAHVDGRVVGRCPAWGGEIMADITSAPEWSNTFFTVSPHGISLEPDKEKTGTVETIVLDQVAVPAGLELTARCLEPLDVRRLETADRIVVGGAGVGDMQGFGQIRELAAALGAEVGATRPPVMNHWADEDRLIGQTGKTVRPKLLISVATSGAIQYTTGIAEAETVVAINNDPNAPIFQWADIGIVGDARTLLPLLTQGARQISMRRLADAACSLDPEKNGAAGFGAMVRQLRKARAWTRIELAEKTGQTPEFIEQVESDQLSPPVGFILGMARAMQVDPGAFLRKEAQSAIRDRRAQAYYQRTREYSYTTLTPGAENSHLRAFLVTIEARQDHKPVAYKHDGEEFIYVLEGDLELTVGTQVTVYKPGESVRFNSDVAHKLKSTSNRTTRCLVVLYTI